MAALKAIIAIMSILIIGRLVLVVWRISTMSGDSGAGTITRSLDLSADCVIEAASTQDGLLTIVIGGAPNCSAVRVIDMATGNTVAEFYRARR